MQKSQNIKKCEICGKIYDRYSTICLGLFCKHKELVEISVEEGKSYALDTNKSKKCPKCGKLHDANSSICLGLFCAHAELINFSKEVTRVFDKAVEDNALKPKEENFGEVHYDD